jgi:hypothetical protein
VVGIERIGESFRIGNGIGDLAMIEVRGKGNETGFGQSGTECLDGVVQSPPGMKDQYTGSLASGGMGKIAVGLNRVHHSRVSYLLKVITNRLVKLASL